jgi:hypothetical protein
VFDRGGNLITKPVPGGGRAVEPTAASNDARQILAQIRADVQASVPSYATAKQRAAAMDAAAKKYRYQNYAEAQAAAGEASQGVQERTPPAPNNQGVGGQAIDVDRVMKYLQQRATQPK